jgi:hypothetical protein
VIALAGTPAFADDVSGNYDVKFEEVANNCSPPPITYSRTKLVIATRTDKTGNYVTVNVETIPEMSGIRAKGSKVNASTKKAVATTVTGLDAKYSVAGKVDDGGMLALVLMAEYIKHDDKKPYCTMSWNVTGLRSGTTDKKQKSSSSR